MKKIILFAIILALPHFTLAEKKVWRDPNARQILPKDQSGKIIFTEVVEVPNVTKDQLYSRAYEWFAKTFKSAQNVIQMEDKENGKIVGKGAFGDINFSANLGLVRVEGSVKFTISVYFKDGKYKFEITDFVHEGIGHYSNGIHNVNGGALENEKPECGRGSMPLGKWNNIKEETDKRVLELIESLRKSMLVESAGDNW